MGCVNPAIYLLWPCGLIFSQPRAAYSQMLGMTKKYLAVQIRGGLIPQKKRNSDSGFLIPGNRNQTTQWLDYIFNFEM